MTTTLTNTYPPFFKQDFQSYPEIREGEAWKNPFNLARKQFVLIDGLTYKQNPCGTIQTQSLQLIILKIGLLLGCSTIFLYKAVPKIKNPTLTLFFNALANISYDIANIIGPIKFLNITGTKKVRYITDEPETISEAINTLEEKIVIPQELVETIRKIDSKNALKRMHDKSIDTPQTNESAFQITGYPNLFFKKCVDYKKGGEIIHHSDERFFNMVIAQALCKKHNWNLLIVPSTKQVIIDAKTRYIVEEELDICTDNAMQAFYFSAYPRRLQQAVKQFFEFIIATHQSNIQFHKNPVVGDPEESSEALSLSLHNLGFTDPGGPEIGLFGSPESNRTGLMGLLGPELLEEMHSYTNEHYEQYQENVKDAVERRRHQLEIVRFYATHRIQNPNTRITKKLVFPTTQTPDYKNYKKAKEILKVCNEMLEDNDPTLPDGWTHKTFEAQALFLKEERLIEINTLEDRDNLEEALQILKAQKLIYQYDIGELEHIMENGNLKTVISFRVQV